MKDRKSDSIWFTFLLRAFYLFHCNLHYFMPIYRHRKALAFWNSTVTHARTHTHLATCMTKVKNFVFLLLIKEYKKKIKWKKCVIFAGLNVGCWNGSKWRMLSNQSMYTYQCWSGKKDTTKSIHIWLKYTGHVYMIVQSTCNIRNAYYDNLMQVWKFKCNVKSPTSFSYH